MEETSDRKPVRIFMKQSDRMDTSSAEVDITKNRRATKWSMRELLGRAIWEVFGTSVFRIMPRQLWVTRRVILRCFGAKIGRHVHIHPDVKIAVPWNIELCDHCAVGAGAILYSLGKIQIGPRTTVSQNAHLCAGSHDHLSPRMELLKTPIKVGSDAWICADVFVGPDVIVGDRAVLGARSVVSKSVAANAIMVGNPAMAIGSRELSPKKE